MPKTKRAKTPGSGRKPKLDPALVAAALVQLRGNLAAVARKFGVQRASVWELVEKTPALQSIQRDAREGMIDDAESSLYRAVIQGEAWAVCFFLKTQGRSRGYIERQEHEHSGALRTTFDLSAATDADLDRILAATASILSPELRALCAAGEGPAPHAP